MLSITNKVWVILNKKQQRKLIIIGFMMLFGAVMESLSVSLILPLITAVMNTATWGDTWYAQILCSVFDINMQEEYITVLLLLLIIIFIVKNLYLLFEYYVQYSFIAKCRLGIEYKLMNSYIRKPYSFFLNSSSGEILRILGDDTEKSAQAMINMLGFYTEIVVSIILSITIFIMSPTMAIGLFIILVLELFIIAAVIKPILKRAGDKYRSEYAAANKWALQAVHGIKSIKVARKEEFFEKKYRKHAKNVVDAFRKHQTLSNAPRLIIEAFTVAATLLMILVMIFMGADLKNIVPQLSAFIVAAVRLLPSTNRISNAFSQIQYTEGALDNVIRVMKEETKASGELTSYFDKGEKRIYFGECGLKGVTFSYMGSYAMILKNADISIIPGQAVGIVGPSGAGKTTMIDILLGLLKPQCGVVFCDKSNIEDNLSGWLSCLAYIPQSIFILDDTIMENVAFGCEYNEIDEEMVWSALKDAQLDEFVRNLPEGLDTRLGEAGVKLSGGQRQRIGIARALYLNPSLIILDEATSALDNETEAAIMESINSLHGHKTMIIIAHRLSTINECDVVYKVEAGKITKVK